MDRRLRHWMMTMLLAGASLAGCREERPRASVGVLEFTPEAVYGATPLEELASTFFATQVARIEGGYFTQTVAEQLGLRGEQAAELDRKVSARRQGESLRLEVEVRGKDPARSTEVCNALLGAIVRERAQMRAQVSERRLQYLEYMLSQLDGGAEATLAREELTRLRMDAATREVGVRISDRCAPRR